MGGDNNQVRARDFVNHWSVGFGGGSTVGKIVIFNGMSLWDTGISMSQIAGDWHEIAVVFGGGFISSYLDGSQVKCEKFAALPLSGEGNLKIGCDRQMLRYYNGQIDDIMIFNYELTADEVSEVFESLSNFDRPAGKWMFDDGTAFG